MCVPKIWLFSLVVASMVAASCDSGTSPSRNGAVIKGHVVSTGNAPPEPGGSVTSAAGGSTLAKKESSTITVSINGTNISTAVDGNGNFELTGVPPGDVTLMFSGSGVNVTLRLTGIPASGQINITVSLNGNSARLEDREDDDNDDDGDDDDHELEGVVSNRGNACPTLTFTVQGTAVRTTSSTKYEHGQCTTIANGTRVEVEGTRQADNSVLAKEVEIK